jgi:GH24 family phage-related lysozyme (muramidase)
MEVINAFVMSTFCAAFELIKKYEGFNERSFPDISSGEAPYSIGFGTQFYPDGQPVVKGQMCTYEKAEEYLTYELEQIRTSLHKEGLDLTPAMEEALISFIHSIGWTSFLYSDILDYIEEKKWSNVAEELYRWVFDSEYNVISSLLYRRKEEINMFLSGVYKENMNFSGKLLLSTFSTYAGKPNQVRAVKRLEDAIHPMLLAEFINEFKLSPQKD